MGRAYDEVSPAYLEFVINHVFLPPRLPQKSEEDVGEKNATLLKLLLGAAQDFVGETTYRTDFRVKDVWKSVVKMLGNLCRLENTDSLSRLAFQNAVEEMVEGDFLVLHMDPQNAGIIIRHLGDQFLFEMFEASPRTVNVVNTSGRLVASFPGPAIEVDVGRIHDPTFLQELTFFFEKMKRDVLVISHEVGKKAGEEIPEDRETPHPKFITQMLVGILRAVGRPADIERIEKHLADQVLWDNARVPWRRSPLWLVVRVALQTTLKRATGSNNEYKTFMIWFMGQVLERATCNKISNEHLFAMNAKVSRRVHKAESLPEYVLQDVRRAGNIADQILQERWLRAQRDDMRAYEWNTRRFNYEADVQLTMCESEAYLTSIQDTQGPAPERKLFQPKERPRIDVDQEFYLPVLSTEKNFSAKQDLNLADFELWVCKSLDSWVRFNTQSFSAYAKLGSRMEEYISMAKPVYAGDPVRMSVLILTAMELWVALDKIAVQRCSLIGDYWPRLSDGLLKPLLLPQACQLARLEEVQDYLRERQETSSYVDVPVFSDLVSPKTFGVRYFEKSRQHKELEKRILRQAEEDRKRKIVEYEAQLHVYEMKLNTAQGMNCGYFTHWIEGWQRHDRKCRKCQLIREAAQMRIEVHEWPLPREKFQRQTAVFELECPPEYAIWRDVTYRILSDVCSSNQATIPAAAPPAYLRTFAGLQRYFKNPCEERDQKLVWASRSKSFVRCHYKYRKFPSNKQQICVPNGLNYGLFDETSRHWTEDYRIELDVRNFCTFRLPAGPYRDLQYTLRATTHTPNQVIARQSQCPPELQIHEYAAFGSLRAGHRLQWRNILRELRGRSLTFSNEEVRMLLTQCAWQAGPRGSSVRCREYHLDLTDAQFGKNLLFELESTLTSIEMNWHAAVAAQSLIILAIQLLAFCDPVEVSIVERCVEFLRRARAASLMWLRELSAKLKDCKVEEMRELQGRVVQMSAICRSTYNVEAVHLPRLLITEEDVAVLVECAISIQQNSSTNIEKLPAAIRALVVWDRRLSSAIEPYLRSLVVEHVGINLRAIWDSYSPGANWECLEYPNDRWVTTTSLPADGSKQSVHYNLLNGVLLVEGLPLGRMPLDYTSHPTYMELFFGKVLDVFPSSMLGMVFETKDPINGHRVGFVLNNGELVIRAKKGSMVYQFIPRGRLAKDFPKHIVSNHVHWMNLRTRDIELRDPRNPWIDKRPERWFISFCHRALYLGAMAQLFDIRSPTAIAISNILAPLEYPGMLSVTYEQRYNSHTGEFVPIIVARLPRLKLDFFVNSSERLECRQFSGMVIDENQAIGTFIGLKNKLLIRKGTTRSVLIPEGRIDIGFPDNSKHVEIEVHTDDLERVKYHQFTIDTLLGRLVGNGSQSNHLFKVYLHAITASCLPDPLTGRTGTEEALAGLRSASTKSFQTLDSRSTEAELLRLIANLTPARSYYPRHMKYMEQIKWNQHLPALSQHEQFSELVQGVFDHARSFRLFDDAPQTPGAVAASYIEINSKNKLSQRAAIRNSRYYTTEFGGVAIQQSQDLVYNSRDWGDESLEEAKVCHIARLVDSWTINMPVYSDLLSLLEKWESFPGITRADDEYTFGYDSRWLEREQLKDYWFTLQRALFHADPLVDKYKIMFLLSTFAMAGVSLDLVRTLLAFATAPDFKELDELPPFIEYNMGEGFEPDIEVLQIATRESGADDDDGDDDDDDYFERQLGGGELTIALYKQLLKRRKEFLAESEKLVQDLLRQWPCQDPIADPSAHPTLDVPMIILRVTPYFRNWHRNLTLREYVLKLQEILSHIHVEPSPESQTLEVYHFVPCSRHASAKPRCLLTLEHLLGYTPPMLPNPPRVLEYSQVSIKKNSARRGDTTSALERIVEHFRGSNEPAEREYSDNLMDSLTALRCEPDSPKAFLVDGVLPRLEQHTDQCRDHLRKIWESIKHTLSPRSLGGDLMIARAGLWPRVTQMALLQLIATSQSVVVPQAWRRVFVSYGLAITMLQRAERLLKRARALGSSHNSIPTEFRKELENVGHQRWDPVKFPDWLLMEIEHNFLVRPAQADIATGMIHPSKNRNSIMQLCMGEGKTNVIVPIACSTLADGDKLVRVVVLKPLSVQMFETLVRKLGGLVNRPVYYMPFSRSVKVGIEQATRIRALFEECMEKKGVLLVLPEHILSFKLLGLEWLYNTRPTSSNPADGGRRRTDEVTRILLDTQAWLNHTSRDLLDESDEILNSKHELIYSIGTATPMNNAPDRWSVIQEIFDHLQRYAQVSGCADRDNIEVASQGAPGQFKGIRILDPQAGQKFLKGVAKRVIEDGLRVISFRRFPRHIRPLVQRFITDPKVSEYDSQPLLDYCGQNESELSTGNLYLLRGLFAYKVLLFSLSDKRWKVDYGLDPKRTMLAVPYRAKDFPSNRSEFSHPDVAITLTCLSYYYGGLTEKQLEICFQNLYKSDNPTMEYELWLKGVELGELKVHHLSGVNLEDRTQWEKLYKILHRNKAAIDFYLATVVFPKEAKEFPYKLSSSGWDLAEGKHHPTTGFSGTNDNRYLLPLSIKQAKTPAQLSTNARVLTNILHDENTYSQIPDKPGSDLHKILETLNKGKAGSIVRVILDVGAQILSLRNRQVVQEWLAHTKEADAEAGVFFNDNDELTVITRDGLEEPLMISAFADKLGTCVVYLDEAHTRGTDLKLPNRIKAAVTLGPGLTKDRLVQACMRMRKLGDGHSITFLGPPEIDKQLREVSGQRGRRGKKICPGDVILWSMTCSCLLTRKLTPIWAKQGLAYQDRSLAWEKIMKNDSARFPLTLLEVERKKLQDYYGFQGSRASALMRVNEKVGHLRRHQRTKIKKRCDALGVKSFHGAPLLEEQEQERERELCHELETEHDNERPARAGPAQHFLAEDVRELVRNGELPRGCRNITPAFHTLMRALGDEWDHGNQWSLNLMATQDFVRTVDVGRDQKTTDYLRPVNWLLSSKSNASLIVLLSPYEVNKLLPQIRMSDKVTLHMYSPRLRKAALSYEDMRFCTLPAITSDLELVMPRVSLIDQLNIFSGQLYFKDMQAYERVCRFLGLHLSGVPEGNETPIDSDGFVKKEYREALGMGGNESPFLTSPVPFLKVLFGARRKGQSFLATHMGQVLHGKALATEDFEELE